jgi:hypothetical protein
MTNAWLQERPHLARLVRSLQAVLELADELYQRGRGSGESVDYSEFEERAHATAEVERGVHHVALSGLDVDAPYIRVWGKYYRCVRRIARTYGSLAGPVTVERTLYREQGRRQAPVLDPVATRAGVVDGSWLPRTARAVAHLAQVTSREACATSRELMRLPYSRCSIERVGHAVGAEYLKRREQVEPQLIEAYEIPEGALDQRFHRSHDRTDGGADSETRRGGKSADQAIRGGAASLGGCTVATNARDAGGSSSRGATTCPEDHAQLPYGLLRDRDLARRNTETRSLP